MITHRTDASDHPTSRSRRHALAVDQPLCEAVGFGIGDVVELALRITDRALNALTTAWPSPTSTRTARKRTWSPAVSLLPRPTPPPRSRSRPGRPRLTNLALAQHSASNGPLVVATEA